MILYNTVTILITCFYFTNILAMFLFHNGYRISNDSYNCSTSRTQFVERYIKQPLDHFNVNEVRTWKMRYFEGLEFWKQGGPVYLLINGETEATKDFLRSTILYELAQETNGALYMSEHRYYGKSVPFSDLNTTTLAYLSSRQALADIAHLLKEIKSLPKYNVSKVAVAGGSYAGNLATWMRLLYPDLVDAAIASSAPVLAKVDFFEYLEVVGNDYKQYGTPDCYREIVKHFKRYDQLFSTRDGINKLKKEENICNSTDFSIPENRQVFFQNKAKNFMSNAQNGSPNVIKSHCNNITEMLPNVLQSLPDKSFVGIEFDYRTDEHDCYSYNFEELIQSTMNVKATMAWAYQTCSEFGYFATTNSENQPFTKNIPIEYYYKICTTLFGPEFNKSKVEEGVKRSNCMYGGLRPNVSQVVFVNGDMDPWHKLGILKDLSKDAPARLVHGTSHCQDLYSNTSEDPKDMKKTKKYVNQLIKKWIAVT